MSLGRFILTVLIASMLAGCAGTGARDRTTATGEPTVQHDKSPAAGQTQAAPIGVEASLPPRARKRPKIAAKPRQAAIQDTEPPKKSGASSGGAASSAKSAVGTQASSAQLARSGSGILGGVPTIASPSGAATAAGGANTETGDAGEPKEPPQTAMLQPGSKVGDRSKATDLPKPPSFRERSLNCDVIELMGKYIGQRHIRGEPRVEATDKAIDDVLRQTGGARDDRFVFSGRVYGMLIYRLERDHSAEGYSAYARSACRILRGGKGIVPADESSEYQLNQALRSCESSTRKRDELYSCISRRMEKVVQERGF